MIHTTFSDGFKALWKDEPQKIVLIECLEEFYNGIKEMADQDAIKQWDIREISEINKEIKRIVQSKDNFSKFHETYPEWINYFLNRITLRAQLKIIDSMELLFYSCNTVNSLGCTLATRSIIEHVAAYQYLYSQIPWKGNQAVSKKEMRQFLIMLYSLGFGSRFNWDLFHSDFKKFREAFESGEIIWNRPKDRRLPNNVEMNRKLDDVLSSEKRIKKGQIFFIYTLLSDIIHPSAGGDFIYSDNMFKQLSVERHLDVRFKRYFLIIGPFNIELIAHFISLCNQMQDCFVNSVDFHSFS